MSQFDLHAPIIAARAAAGFAIGMKLTDIQEILSYSRIIDYHPGFNLVESIHNNSGVLCVRGLGGNQGTIVHFGPDMVRLSFNEAGVLGCIYVFDGYLGKYGDAVIGSPLSVVAESEPLVYDEHDEMYYRDDMNGDYIPGLAICALDAKPEEFSNTSIYGFCIHDWSLFRKI